MNRPVARSLILLLLALGLIAAAVPALATPIKSSTTYNVSGSFGSQSFTGTIVWNGNKVTSYTLNFGGLVFSCTGGCSTVHKTFKLNGANDTLAGFFNPNGSPFSLTVKQTRQDPTYWTNLAWSPVSVSEESALMQLACMLLLFAVAIPKARLLGRKVRS